MVTLTKSGNAVKFAFDDNPHYLNNGEIEVPVNSLSLVIDDSEMATFRKASANDIFLSISYDELGMTKAELESFYKENMVGSTGGGGGSITSGEVQSMIDESISGKADTSAVTSVDDALTAHTANTTVHVTAADKTNWNAKSDFSGSYNDLTDKPTIPTVPTSNTAFTNDAGYITADAISGKADTSAVTESINAAVSGKADTSAITSVDDALTAHTANTTVHVTAQDKSNWNAKSDFSGDYNDLTNKPTIPTVPTSNTAFTNDAGYITSSQSQSAITAAISGKADVSYVDTALSGKQDTLTAGDGIDIVNNAISFSSEKEETISSALNEIHLAVEELEDSVSGKADVSYVDTALSGKQDALEAGTGIDITDNVISVTGGGGGGGSDVVELTQAQYDALATKDPSTFYIITDATPIDMSNYWTSAQTQSAITTSVSGKQDTLVSGTNIKTINNQSILGSGNITIEGSVTVDQTIIENSTNAVAGGAVYAAIGDIESLLSNI